MCAEPLPGHPPGSEFPLQLMDTQMKGEISCVLDLQVAPLFLFNCARRGETKVRFWQDRGGRRQPASAVVGDGLPHRPSTCGCVGTSLREWVAFPQRARGSITLGL